MTYAEAVARLTALRGGEHAGMRPGLERIDGLLGALGHPETRYALVQVGGTNGKGSVAVMLAAMLTSAGRRVGLYTSPHLVSFRERIRVDGEPIGEDGVADGVEALGTLIARFDATMFEATTALALDHFARESVEVAVLEVGLGGRLDATTVGRPVATALARIDLDHESVLGPTLARIAVEKAAIIRSGVAFSAAQAPAAAAIVVERAAVAGVPLRLEGRDLQVVVRSRTRGGQVIDCRGPGWEVAGLHLPLLGSFQPSNALLAVAVARELGVDEAAIRRGVERVRWPGRFQVIGREPTFVLDGAHNPAAAQALATSLREVFGGEPVTVVLGVSGDKDARGILAALAPVARRLILTRASNPRAAAPSDLRRQAPPTIETVETAPSVREALALATEAPTTPIVCVTGSLFLVGEALVALGARGDKPCPVGKGADSIEFLFS
ncbi:MAG: bifunctional folylpolyglutamate synthase/dihydrofolate synthase [Candidatus Rokubacteria bacterium]|nr:bifunctional folylpolyglutamate synthase/dihydrofolate synthase [Candidatus Rokubacteria bacterium]